MVEETIDLPQVPDKRYHKICIKYTSPRVGFELLTLVVIGIDCTDSCKSNYHTITVMMAIKNIRVSELTSEGLLVYVK